MFANFWPFDTMWFAYNSYQEGRDLVVSLYRQNGSEIKVKTVLGEDREWHSDIVFFDRYKDMTDIKTIGFHATPADIRIDNIRFNVPVQFLQVHK